MAGLSVRRGDWEEHVEASAPSRFAVDENAATVVGDNPVKKLHDEIWAQSFDIMPEADKQRRAPC